MRSIGKEVEEGGGEEEAPSRPQVRRRHEIPDVIEVSSKGGTQNARVLEVLGAAAEAMEGSDSCGTNLSLKGVLEFLKEGLVRQLGFKGLEDLSTLVGILSLPVQTPSLSNSCAEGLLLLTL